MTTEIVLPKMGLTMEEAEMLAWEKKVGDYVEKHEVILTIQTDKAALEVEAPVDGILQDILVKEGEVVPVGTVLGYISDTKEQDEPVNMFQNIDFPVEEPYRIRISPAARKLARENGIEIEGLRGSGPRGRILLMDVQEAIAEKSLKERKIEIDTIKTKLPVKTTKARGKGKHVPLTRMRKIIAERMTQSFMMVPQFQLKKQVDVTAILQVRNLLVSSFEESIGVRLSINDFLIQAVALTLKKHPSVNASYIDSDTQPYIYEHDDINVGLAVAVDDGLVVPVIHNADQMSLAEIAKKRVELIEKAKKGILKPEEMSHGTFTISNLASFEIDEFVAIVNPPEAGILAVGQVREQPVVVDNRVEIKPVLILNASFDHRIIDGADGSKFISDLVQHLQSDRWKIF
ncbi:dihydrolipoyllysine-residue acetyltransferase component of acetoin cleaving system [Collibacillus ludicampi]|uniref:Dihydrolipoamide acetyltransferase component of pyruvate dehydrogenase complex n=1 Tax=Collibacillus ludicampi TaxID=2771369 RepID=A0AAV4LAQ2_9BACL|nr:dihydrolipoamide acetyltransferase family protein [Collibacillus ludicampi]GIM44954.1 dihydrolipoyllysine-residue acetyltransferase component of acetoin cleaving system [Collibacillus ludicampi]